MSKETDNMNAVHLLTELRGRLIHSLVIFMLLFAVLTYYSNPLYTLLANPLLKFLPQGHLIATEIVSPFFVPFKLAFMAAMLLGVPYFLYSCGRLSRPHCMAMSVACCGRLCLLAHFYFMREWLLPISWFFRCYSIFSQLLPQWCGA